ncbi:MAG: P27 family phage terminase small subunit [Planctomycetota bacterium]|nr:P27 family phage terminase small subunit [Planctomycetota bacterium]
MALPENPGVDREGGDVQRGLDLHRARLRPRAGHAGARRKAGTGKTRCAPQRPPMAIANELAQELSRLEAEFGMTPSARSRIQVEKPKVLSSWDRFLLARDRSGGAE